MKMRQHRKYRADLSRLRWIRASLEVLGERGRTPYCRGGIMSDELYTASVVALATLSPEFRRLGTALQAIDERFRALLAAPDATDPLEGH